MVDYMPLLSNDCFDFSLQKTMHYAMLYLSQVAVKRRIFRGMIFK